MEAALENVTQIMTPEVQLCNRYSQGIHCKLKPVQWAVETGAGEKQ